MSKLTPLAHAVRFAMRCGITCPKELAAELECTTSAVYRAIKMLGESDRTVTQSDHSVKSDRTELTVQSQSDHSVTKTDRTVTAAKESSPHTPLKEKNNKLTTATALGESEQINPAALAEKMFEAGGKALNRTTAALENFSEPLAWIDQGADLERDILPTIRDIGGRMIAKGRTISGWGYFTKAVAEAKSRRQATVNVFANALAEGQNAGLPSASLGFKLDPSTPRYCKPAPGSELLENEEIEETPFMRNWKNRVLKEVGDARH